MHLHGNRLILSNLRWSALQHQAASWKQLGSLLCRLLQAQHQPLTCAGMWRRSVSWTSATPPREARHATRRSRPMPPPPPPALLPGAAPSAGAASPASRLFLVPALAAGQRPSACSLGCERHQFSPAPLGNPLTEDCQEISSGGIGVSWNAAQASATCQELQSCCNISAHPDCAAQSGCCGRLPAGASRAACSLPRAADAHAPSQARQQEHSHRIERPRWHISSSWAWELCCSSGGSIPRTAAWLSKDAGPTLTSWV